MGVNSTIYFRCNWPPTTYFRCNWPLQFTSDVTDPLQFTSDVTDPLQFTSDVTDPLQFTPDPTIYWPSHGLDHKKAWKFFIQLITHSPQVFWWVWSSWTACQFGKLLSPDTPRWRLTVPIQCYHNFLYSYTIMPTHCVLPIIGRFWSHDCAVWQLSIIFYNYGIASVGHICWRRSVDADAGIMYEHPFIAYLFNTHWYMQMIIPSMANFCSKSSAQSKGGGTVW